jgi:hypothetical protein
MLPCQCLVLFVFVILLVSEFVAIQWWSGIDFGSNSSLRVGLLQATVRRDKEIQRRTPTTHSFSFFSSQQWVNNQDTSSSFSDYLSDNSSFYDAGIVAYSLLAFAT